MNMTPSMYRLQSIAQLAGRLLCLFAILAFGPRHAVGQVATSDIDAMSITDSTEIVPVVKKKKLAFPARRIGFTPSAAFNTYMGLQISNDWSKNGKANFGFEAAYLAYNIVESTNVAGVRLRPQVEFLVSDDSAIGLSFGLGLNFRYTIENRASTFWNQQGNFGEIIVHRPSLLFFGGFLSSNLVIKASDRVYVELGGGLGIGTYSYRINLPDRGANVRPEPDFGGGFLFGFRNTDFTQALPIFFTHLNISYALPSGRLFPKRDKSKKRNKRKKKRRKRR